LGQLLLIDTTDPPELYVMIGVVLIAVVAFAAARAQRFTEAAIAPKWLLRGWRPLARVPGDVAILTREAIAQLVVRKRGPIGSFRAIPFRGGEAESDYGRRALAEIRCSAASARTRDLRPGAHAAVLRLPGAGRRAV
jgi:hypothetical protein